MSKQSSESKSISTKQYRDGQSDLIQRLSILESNMNRVCLQQDAMIPFISSLDVIQKLEAQVKGLIKRQEELECSVKEKSRDTSANTSFSDFRSAVKHTSKPVERQLQELNLRVNSLDSQLLDVQRACQEVVAGQSPIEHTDLVRLEQLIKEEMVQMKADVQTEYKNIYREISGLKCDLEYIMNNQKKQKITGRMQQMNFPPDDKLFVINLLEQENFIDDLDHYENENTFRMLFELDYFEHQKEQISSLDQLQTQRESMYLDGKLIQIKYQLAASKRKYLGEIKKIEHKFQIINEMISQNPKYGQHASQIIQLDQKLKKIVKRLHTNIDLVFSKINLLDQK